MAIVCFAAWTRNRLRNTLIPPIYQCLNLFSKSTRLTKERFIFPSFPPSSISKSHPQLCSIAPAATSPHFTPISKDQEDSGEAPCFLWASISLPWSILFLHFRSQDLELEIPVITFIKIAEFPYQAIPTYQALLRTREDNRNQGVI